MNIHIVLITIILLFTLYNAVSIMMDSESFICKILALIAFLIALWLMFQRDTYLPFLGRMALPSSVIKDTTFPINSNVDISIPFNVKDGTKVVYWGAKPSKNTISNPMKAYGDFSNAGVTTVFGGKAQVRFNCPSKYTVGIGKTLNRHIHYRFMYNNGMMSPVMTKFVNC
ncbi:MAG: hypothetical protein EBU66_15635 [Bacteroidetes bacterium]|nr:hypothetical protein [Bacteroidota bacterium]